MKKALLSLFLLLPLLLGACAGRAETPYSVSIWYIDGDSAAPVLTEAAERYNKSKKPEDLAVRLRAFPDEAQLAAALDTARPDLLLCSHERAFDLFERGLLTAARAEGIDFADWLLRRSESIGQSVFPLGAQVQLLYARADAAVEADVPGLCERAAEEARSSRLPWLNVEAFAPLFCQAMLDLGREFRADGGREIFTEEYRAVHNTLAGAIYAGGLLCDGRDGAALVRGGVVPCALMDSAALKDAAREGFAFLAPSVEGERLARLACLACFAPSGRQGAGAAAFLGWLYEGERLGALALENGLVPVSAAPENGDALHAALCAVARGDALYLPGAESAYVRCRDDFEQRFRHETEFLQ